MRIAINGFGRIGRQFYRLTSQRPELEIIAINDLADPELLAYLLKYDSVYGRFNGEFKARLFSEKDPAKLPWASLGVDLVIEATGRLTKGGEARKHLQAGAKKVIISANSKDADLSVVLGVNEKEYRPSAHHLLSNCSCTTNGAAPVIKILHENLTVLKAQIMTVHAVTASQSLVDGPREARREGRAAFANIIPAETGAAKAVARVLPELEGRISGSAFRVPVLCGSVLEIVAQIKVETTAATINKIFQEAAAGELKGILAVSTEGLVSQDIVGTSLSAIVDLPLTEVLDLPKVRDENLIKVVAWYDNEWGYSSRLVDLAALVGSHI